MPRPTVRNSGFGRRVCAAPLRWFNRCAKSLRGLVQSSQRKRLHDIRFVQILKDSEPPGGSGRMWGSGLTGCRSRRTPSGLRPKLAAAAAGHRVQPLQRPPARPRSRRAAAGRRRPRDVAAREPSASRAGGDCTCSPGRPRAGDRRSQRTAGVGSARAHDQIGTAAAVTLSHSRRPGSSIPACMG